MSEEEIVITLPSHKALNLFHEALKANMGIQDLEKLLNGLELEMKISIGNKRFNPKGKGENKCS